MRLLAIDTSGPAASAATVLDGVVVCQAVLENNKTHSEKIVGLIDFVLGNSGLTKKTLDAIAVTTGPGSFTGLRIGLSLVKAMSQALDIPCIGVNTLDTLCYVAGSAALRCAVMDARRQEVYSAVYDGDALFVGHGVRPIGALLEQLQCRAEPVLFAGDGIRVYRDQIVHTLLDRARFVPEPYAIQSAACAGILASKTDRSYWKDAYTLEATYYRQSQAEREAAQRRHG